MELKEALNIFNKNIKNRKVLGYWIKNDGFIFNTKSIETPDSIPIPGQFVVSSEGKVYPTNPVLSKLTQKGYKRI